MTDPLLRARIGHVLRRVPLPQLDDLLPLDAILISHGHADHLDLPSLRLVAMASIVLTPVGCGSIVRRADPGGVVGVAVGERYEIGAVAVEAVPARHDGRRHPLGRRLPALGFLLDGPARVWFAGDTGFFPEMEALAGRVDVALLPVAGWGPRLPAGHMDAGSAARAVALVRPRIAVPIHWGTMRSIGTRADADPRTPARAFAAAVARLRVPAEVRVLLPGETMAL
jgi:L-ascorbate metabolism protein UlaG (beta-lactamase superfamily)